MVSWSTLHLLFLSSIFHLLSSLAIFQPENVFRVTNSRITTSTELLFRRLATLNPLTPTQETLKTLFTSTEARGHYLALGPDPLLHCPFCSPEDPNSYIYFALPSILAPYLLHIGFLGLITSSSIFGVEPARWRTQAIIAGIILGAMEIYMRLTYDLRASIAEATRTLTEPDPWHWKVLMYRGISLAMTDAGLAYMIYLSATNRAFLKPVSIDDRLEDISKKWEGVNTKIQALGITRSTIQGKGELRRTVLKHWASANEVTQNALKEEEVQRYMKTVKARWDMRKVEMEAEGYAEGLVEGARRMLNVEGLDEEEEREADIRPRFGTGDDDENENDGGDADRDANKVRHHDVVEVDVEVD
ncbi:MAG: hypothetical protein M1823_000581 [Watsoniomyces obsoletus]|nr:MAG: hypothetical protein M1823_000581 [Watsoniomyces obsoletus]